MTEPAGEKPELGCWMRVSTVTLLELGKAGNRLAFWLSFKASRLYAWAEKRAIDKVIAEQLARREVREHAR